MLIFSRPAQVKTEPEQRDREWSGAGGVVSDNDESSGFLLILQASDSPSTANDDDGVAGLPRPTCRNRRQVGIVGIFISAEVCCGLGNGKSLNIPSNTRSDYTGVNPGDCGWR